MACFGRDFDDEVPDSECPDCGAATENGTAVNNCSYSPVVCDTCGWQPCDESC